MTPRILFVPEAPLDFSAALQLQVLIKSLDRERFQLELAVPCPADNGGSFEFGVCTDYFDRQPHPLQTALWLKNLIAEKQPDLIHAWGKGARRLVAASTKMSKRLQRVFTLTSKLESAGPLEVWSSAMLSRHDDCVVIPHWTVVDHPADQRIDDRLKVIPNSVAGEVHDSATARQELLELTGLEQKEHSGSSRRRTNERPWLVGTVSSFDPKARLKDLVWAVDLLCCVRSDIHLLIFGTGNDTGLRQYVANTLAGDNIHIIPTELFSPQQLAGLDIYWNAQLETPNPTAMLQAMASRIPVVSVLGEETDESVLPLQTALATNFGSRDEFARWTKFLIEQPEARQQLAQQAQQYIQKKFPTSTTVSAYQDLYSRLLGSPETRSN